MDVPQTKYTYEQEPCEPIASSKWVQDQDGKVCIAEAKDGKGKVLARVKVQLEVTMGQDLRHYHGTEGEKEIARSVEAMAIQAAKLAK